MNFELVMNVICNKSTLILTAFLSQLWSSHAMAIEKPCLEQLTDLTVIARQCRANLNIDDDCSAEIKAAKVQELICERDGFKPERIKKAIEIGEVIVETDEQNSPTRIWIDQYVTSALSLNRELLQQQVELSLAPVIDRIAQQEQEIRELKVQLALLNKAINSRTPSELTNEKFNELKRQVLQNSKSTAASNELTVELAKIKDRLRSIDSSRQSVNYELLNLKQQLNTLLLENQHR